MKSENLSYDERTAFAAANYILDHFSEKDNSDLTNLKLQKLLYFAYGVHLSLCNERLFEDRIEAWKLGPVVPSIYREFKDHGNNPIGAARATILRDDYSGDSEMPIIDRKADENRAKSLFIACAYGGNKTAWELVEKLHGNKTAWARNFDGSRGKAIPDEDILQEFNEARMDEIATFILG